MAPDSIFFARRGGGGEGNQFSKYEGSQKMCSETYV
jgi:hypothetical protein